MEHYPLGSRFHSQYRSHCSNLHPMREPLMCTFCLHDKELGGTYDKYVLKLTWKRSMKSIIRSSGLSDPTFSWVTITPIPTIGTTRDRLGLTATAVVVGDAAIAVWIRARTIQMLEETWGAKSSFSTGKRIFFRTLYKSCKSWKVFWI